MAHCSVALVLGLLGCLLLSECADVCSVDNGECNQICTNEQGGKASCSCVDGYHLLEDQKTCEPSGPFPCGKIGSPEGIPTVLERLPIDKYSQFNSWKGQAPWQVYVINFQWIRFCEGVLISDKWVITAAHCLEYKPHTIVAGEYNTDAFDHTEQARQILRAVQHPSYNEANRYENDLALLELSTPLVLNKYITPICIGNKRLTEYSLKHGRGILSSWWTSTHTQKVSTVLQHVDIKYIDLALCLRKNETNTFCADHANFTDTAFQGNGGAPVTTDWDGVWFLTGILTCGAECMGGRLYHLFTSIANHTEWIQNVTRGEQ